MSTRLIAWRDDGIWTWAALYLLEHKEQYIECKTTRNNRLKGKFYRDLYEAYIRRPEYLRENAPVARTSRSLRDLISDRGKLCRYIHELAEMRNKKVDLSWVSRRILDSMDPLLKIIPNPKGLKTEGRDSDDHIRPTHTTNRTSDGWIEMSDLQTPVSYQMLISLPKGLVVKTSAKCKPMLGYDMVGMHFTGTVAVNNAKDDTPNMLQRLVGMKKLGTPVTKLPLLYKRRTSNHTYIWVEAYSHVVKTQIDRAGKVHTTVCLIERDVTDAVCWGRNKELSRWTEAAPQRPISSPPPPPLLGHAVRRGLSFKSEFKQEGMMHPPIPLGSPPALRSPPVLRNCAVQPAGPAPSPPPPQPPPQTNNFGKRPQPDGFRPPPSTHAPSCIPLEMPWLKTGVKQEPLSEDWLKQASACSDPTKPRADGFLVGSFFPDTSPSPPNLTEDGSGEHLWSSDDSESQLSIGAHSLNSNTPTDDESSQRSTCPSPHYVPISLDSGRHAEYEPPAKRFRRMCAADGAG